MKTGHSILAPACLGIGLSLGIFLGGSGEEGSPASATGSPAQAASIIGPPESAGHYAIGWNLARDSGLTNLQWSPESLRSLSAGIADAIADGAPRADINLAQYKDLRDQMVAGLPDSADASQELFGKQPASLQPLLDAYRAGSFLQISHPSGIQIAEEESTVLVHFGTSLIDEWGLKQVGPEGYVRIDLEATSPVLSRALRSVGVGGEIQVTVPVRFLFPGQTPLGHLHPDRNVLYRVQVVEHAPESTRREKPAAAALSSLSREANAESVNDS